jgi:hypothetical protein
MNVDHEIGLLITELQRLGAPSAAHDGKVAVRSLRSRMPRFRGRAIGSAPVLRSATLRAHAVRVSQPGALRRHAARASLLH